MRPALRLLASVTKSSAYEPGLPTGITGLLTHKSPRSTLLYLYSSTLDKLKEFPESSVYRQSTEALTRHRMSIVESIQPAGLSEWQNRVSKLVDQHPQAFKRIPVTTGSKSDFNIVYHAPDPVLTWRTEDQRVNAAYKAKPQAEGPQEFEDVKDRGKELARDMVAEEASLIQIEPEPQLSLEQVGEVEQRIGAGLIEEVIAVARGEKELATVMMENEVYV